MEGTSPKSAQQEFDSKVKSGEMSAEELATVPSALRNFDEGEEKVEEGEISYER